MKFSLTIRQLVYLFSAFLVVIPSVFIICLSFFNIQKSITSIISILSKNEMTDFKSSLSIYLSEAKIVNREVNDLIELNVLSLKDKNTFLKALVGILRRHPNLMSVEFASEDDESIGASRDVFNSALTAGISGLNTGYSYRLFNVDEYANIKDKTWELAGYDSRLTSWYTKAKSSNVPQWTPVYLWPNNEFGLDFVSQVVSTPSGQLAGVVDVSIKLTNVRSFVENSKQFPNTQVFLLENDGLIVSGTNVDPPNSDNKRINANESNNPILKDAYKLLLSRYPDLSNIGMARFDSVLLNNTKHFLIAENFTDDTGLNWIILIANNYDDLMDKIVANIQTQIAILAVVLLLVFILAWVFSSYIIKPIDQLVSFSKLLANGERNLHFDLKRDDEIGKLGSSLELMARQITADIDKLTELDKLKDNFLSVTTHELKTPLIPIKSQAQLLLAGDYGVLNAKQKAAVEMIFRNEENLNLLSSEVLDIAKIKSNKLKLILEQFNLGVLIATVIDDFALLIAEKHLILKLSPLPKVLIVYADKPRIAQVLRNLIDNAIKFTPEGGKIRIIVKKNKNEVVVVIKDTGIGIDAKYLPKLFTPFFQIDSSLSRKYRGTGLGLPISKGIIDAHGGKIWAESEGNNKGCTFGFSLLISS